MIMLKKEKSVLPVSVIIQDELTHHHHHQEIPRSWQSGGNFDVAMSSGGRQSPISMGCDPPQLLSPVSNASFVSTNGGPSSPGLPSPSYTVGSSGSNFINSSGSGGSSNDNGNGNLSTSPSQQYPPNHPLSGSKHLCSICGDRASGKHYGVYSCEGCKGFFKRTVRKELGLSYNCREKKNCIIDKRQRNRCQYCRYKKCISCGMKREAVQVRVIRKQNRGLIGLTIRGVMNILTQEERQRTKEKGELGECNQTNGSTNDMPVSKIREAEMLYEPHDIKTFDQKPDMTEYCQSAKDQMEKLVQWAKHIPHFCNLPLIDQMVLLQSGWNELLIASFSHRSINVDDAIIVNNGIVVDRTTMHDFAIEGIFDRVLSELVAKMREMKMDKTEIGCLRAIVLYNPDAKGLGSTTEVEKLREKVYVALEEYTKTNYVMEPGRFPKLLLRLPALRSIGLKCSEYLGYPKLANMPIDKCLLNLLDDQLPSHSL